MITNTPHGQKYVDTIVHTVDNRAVSVWVCFSFLVGDSFFVEELDWPIENRRILSDIKYFVW